MKGLPPKEIEEAMIAFGRTRQALLGHRTARILTIEELTPLVEADDKATDALRSAIAKYSLSPEEARAILDDIRNPAEPSDAHAYERGFKKLRRISEEASQ